MTNLTQNSPQSLDTSLHIELRISLVVLVLLFSLAMQFNHANIASAAPNISYNCSSNPETSSGHCYSLTGWLGAMGVYTAIFTNRLQPGNGFVTNEIWLQNKATSQWVEGGLQSVATSVCLQQGGGQYCPDTNAEFLFWGDVNDGGSFYFHPGPTLASSDLGKFASVEILRTSPTSNEYAVYLTLPSGTQQISYSVNNTMSDDEIHLGAEMQGTSGATAPTNGYTDNEWYNANGGGEWEFQGDPPTTTDLGSDAQFVMNPPWNGWWASPPSTDDVGGDWRTCLPSAGC